MVISDHCNKMGDNDVIRNLCSPWASQVVLVPKPGGKLRFCGDYRQVNAATKKNVFPLPRVDNTLDALQGNVYFSTLDLASGYWQIPIAKKDKGKTAFITLMGLFEFNVMPFGLTKAPAIFAQMMNAVLGGLLWVNCLVYLDNIIIFSRTWENHFIRLDLVLN